MSITKEEASIKITDLSVRFKVQLPNKLEFIKSKLKPFFLLLWMFSFCSYTYADVGNMDIIELKYNGSHYYLPLFSSGILKNSDLCYYDNSNGEYIGEVEDEILRNFENHETVTLYTLLEKINIKKFGTFTYEGSTYDDVLYIHKNPHEVNTKHFKANHKLLDAFNGNTSGFTHTPDLKSLNNTWIDSYPIEFLFEIKGFDICNYSFFGIKGNTSKQEKAILRKMILAIINKNDYDAFERKLSELYKMNVVMIGICSC